MDLRKVRGVLLVVLVALLGVRTGVINLPDFGGFDFEIPIPIVDKPVLSQVWIVADASDGNTKLQGEIVTSGWFDDLKAKGVKAGTLYIKQANEVTRQVEGMDLPAVVLTQSTGQENQQRVIEKWSLGDMTLDQLEAKIAEVSRYAN